MKYFVFIILIIAIKNSYAEEQAFAIDLGLVQLGESRIPIDLQDFHTLIETTQADLKITSKFIPNSVQWVRLANNLLSPRARLSIQIHDLQSNYFLKSGDKIFLPEQRNKTTYIELYISLFNPGEIKVFSQNKLISNIEIRSNFKVKSRNSVLIDYSCAPFSLEIEGVVNEYLSVACLLSKTGEFGHEKPRLEVTWVSTNLKLLDGTPPPFVTILTGNNPARVSLKDAHNVTKTITIKAHLPKKVHRLKTALGFGPYSFHAESGNKARPAKIAPAAFLYGKYDINNLSSWRFFNAAVWNNKSIFNNAGLYFAYEVANAFDKRVSIVPLLGLQGLTYRFDSTTFLTNKIIYPQGFEVVYHHAFGNKNYSLVYGMFLSTSSDDEYQNVWLRYGKRVFWELNYIDFKTDNNLSKMWGLSVGFPFIQFF